MTGSASRDDADYEDLLESLKWGATLELTPEQRQNPAGLCHKIADGKGWVPSWRLKEAQEAKRAAQQRIKCAEPTPRVGIQTQGNPAQAIKAQDR